MPDYLVQEEDGTSRIDLEDSSDSVLLEDGDPTRKARTTQVPVEAGVVPDDALARTTQVPVEAGIVPDDAKGRLTQMVVEVPTPYNPEIVVVHWIDYQLVED